MHHLVSFISSGVDDGVDYEAAMCQCLEVLGGVLQYLREEGMARESAGEARRRIEQRKVVNCILAVMFLWLCLDLCGAVEMAFESGGSGLDGGKKPEGWMMRIYMSKKEVMAR